MTTSPIPLIRLTDNGSPHFLTPSHFNITGRDTSWTPHAENFVQANRHALGELNVDISLTPRRNTIHLGLRPHGRIGAVPLLSPDTRRNCGGVVVRPRFGWNEIGPVLQTIGWSASPHILPLPIVPGSTREVPPWVLAGPILSRLSRLLQELKNSFYLRKEVRQTPRGQIQWAQYATRFIARGTPHKLPCLYPDLGPDKQLQRYIKWGLENILASLHSHAKQDIIARNLSEQIKEMLVKIIHITPQIPQPHEMNVILRMEGFSSPTLQQGIQALGWLVNERGLAGSSASDGLSWYLTMHELFERWVVHLACVWAKSFGGKVRSGLAKETTTPLAWSHTSHSSMSHLEPDVVIQGEEQTIILDAKYKSHFEDFDTQRWLETHEDLRAQHRHDIHQILAYSALFDTKKITAALIYPMRSNVWEKLWLKNKTICTANLGHHGRNLRIALCGVPLHVPYGKGANDIVKPWDSIIDNQEQYF